MTINNLSEIPTGARELSEYYNQMRQAKLMEVRRTYPHNQLTIPNAEGIYRTWSDIQELFFNEQNCSNPQSIRQGITLIKQHLKICTIARLFRNYLTREKEAIENRNNLHADVIERVSACKYCRYEGISGSKHLRGIFIDTELIVSSETAAIFLSYGDRMSPLDNLSDRELLSIIRELNELKEESQQDDVKGMSDAYIILIENYITYKSIRDKWRINDNFIENDIYLQLLENKSLLNTFVKIPALRKVLTAHQTLARQKAATDAIPEKRVFLEAEEEKFFTEEVGRIDAIFRTLEGFRKEDIQKINSRSKTLRDSKGVSRSLKQELFEIQKNAYKLLNLFEDPKVAVAKKPKETVSSTSFLPKGILNNKTKAATQQKQKKTKRTKRSSNRRQTVNHQAASSSTPPISSPKPIKKTPKIWTKQLPNYTFPHHLFWDQRIIRWFRRDPECLQEGSYKDLSPEEKKLEHHFHSLPPCLDRFLDSEYAVRSIWQNEVTSEAHDMYSIPMAVEYKDPYTEENVLEFGHHCTVVNPKTNVIYHRYFHRSERQTFYRTGLTKEALRNIWKGQKHLPKISTEATIPMHKNNRPKEDVEKLYNRFTQSIVIIDKLYGLKITLFRPSLR